MGIEIGLGRFSNNFELLARSKKPVNGRFTSLPALPTFKLIGRVW